MSRKFGLKSLFVVLLLFSIATKLYIEYPRYSRWRAVVEFSNKYREDRENYLYFRFYDRLFELSGNEFLSTLETHPIPSIRIQAQWKNISNELTSEKNSREQHELLNKFIGEIESVTENRPPEWWVNLLDGEFAHSQTNEQVRRGDYDPFSSAFSDSISLPTNPPDLMGPSIFEFAFCPKGDNLKIVNENTIYISKNREFTLPDGFVDPKYDSFPMAYGIVGLFTEKLFVVTKYHWGCESHDVLCFDTDTGKRKWLNQACGLAPVGMYRGLGFYNEYALSDYVEITESKSGEICVFGSDSSCVYAHSFDRHTGKTTFRFSSDYCCNKE